MAITFWRNVQRKITTQEMDASFDTLVNDIANAGISSEMPEGTIYIGDNTNTASLETLDTSIVPETTDKRYQSDLQDTYNDATSSIQGQLDDKLDLDGGNANQDIDIGNYSLNAKHVKINGTAGSGHLGLKHQSSNITASASESSIGADIVGDPVWKNDGGAIDKLELQSNKTGTVTGNEASTTKYLTVKGVYDWAVGLFAPIASPTFTGTATTPDLLVSSATASTPTFFDATKKLITTTAQLWGTWVQTWSNKATPVDADTIGFHDSASTFVGVKSTLLNFWTAYLLPKVQALGYLSGSGLTTNTLPLWGGSSLADSRFRQNYSIYSTSVKGNSSYSRAFCVFDSSENELFVVKNDGGYTSITGDYIEIFKATGGTQPVWNTRISSKGGALGYNLFLPTDANFSANPLGCYHQPSDTYTVEVLSTGQQRNSAINDTESTVIHRWRNRSTTQVALIQNDGMYLGTGTKSASAVLQADSTTKGFLPPRMTNAQMLAIASPATGLLVYQTDGIVGLYLYKNSGWSLLNSTINTKQTDLYFTSGMLTMTTAYPDAGTITKFINNNAMFATAQYSLNGGGAWTNITFTANVATVSIAMSANSNIMVRTTLAGANVDGTLTIQATL